MTSRSSVSHVVTTDRKGRTSVASPGTAPGLAADGATVFEILNCPAAVRAEDAVALAGGFVPPAGIYAVDYDRLAARQSGSCCGGCCG